MNTNKKYKIDYFFIIAILLAALPRLFLCFYATPLRYHLDEVAVMSGCAYFSNLDWSNVLSQSSYYGQGFYILFAPLFYITKNPYIIFYTMIAVVSLLQSCTVVFAYKALKRFFGITACPSALFFSVACSYMLETRTTILFNEQPLLIVSWAVLYILLLLHESLDNEKNKRKYTLLLVLIISYSLTLHTRALTFFLGLFITIVLYYWVYKKVLVSVGTLIISGTISYCIANSFIKFTQQAFWRSTEPPLGLIDWIINELKNLNILFVTCLLLYMLIYIYYLKTTDFRDKISNIYNNKLFKKFLAGAGIILVVVISCFVVIKFSNYSGAEKLPNASINLSAITYLFQMKSWQAWANIIIGQLNTGYIVSGGILLIIACCFISLIIKLLLKDKTIINIGKAADTNIISKLFLISVFYLSCIFMTIGAQSITWLPGATDGILNGFASNSYGFKAFVYFRYYALYTGPLLFIGFIYLYYFNDTIKKNFKLCNTVMILLQFYWFVCIVPYIVNFKELGTSKFYPFVFFLTGTDVNLKLFVGTSLVVFVLWVINWYLIYKKKYALIGFILSLLLIYQHISLSFGYDFGYQHWKEELVNKSYEVITSVEEVTKLPYELYVPIAENNSDARIYMYQFYLNRHKILTYYPDGNISNGIVFMEKPNDSYLLGLGYQMAKLDNNEYMYIQNNELINLFKEYGISFSNN